MIAAAHKEHPNGHKKTVRYIQVLILRVLVDPTLPDALRGSVQAVGESELHPFADSEALLALLRELLQRASEETTLPSSKTDG